MELLDRVRYMDSMNGERLQDCIGDYGRVQAEGC